MVASIRNRQLWVNPDSASAQAEREYRERGDRPRAHIFAQIAKVPTAVWIVGSSTASYVRSILAKDRGKLKVLVFYNAPYRDGNPDPNAAYSGGGARDLAAYLAWARDVISGFGDDAGDVAVVLEPDGLAMLPELPAVRQAERLECMRQITDLLVKAGVASVYHDAGDSGWTNPLSMADRLVQAGVVEGGGFATNVSHFRTSKAEHAYAAAIRKEVYARTGVWLRYVVDTSRNAKGPKVLRLGASKKTGWCNPRGMGIGARPNLALSQSLYKGCDGVLHVKGYASDGKMCPTGREGAAPDAGKRYDDYVVEDLYPLAVPAFAPYVQS